MALRLLLGVAETGKSSSACSSNTTLTLPLAAFAPGVTFFLSFFYSRREVGFRQG